MSDADSARIAKHLGDIDHHLRDLTTIMKTMNENFVEFVKVAKKFTDSAEITIDQAFFDGFGNRIGEVMEKISSESKEKETFDGRQEE
jgi:hypothetical protein